MTGESTGMQDGTEAGLFDLVFLFAQRVALEAVFPVFIGLFLVVVFIRDYIQTNRVHLNNLDLHLALRAVEDFAFLDFVFINVKINGTFRTADHGQPPSPG
jgi:hypothetical protein